VRYAVNCSLIFTELALLERPAAARAAGFSAIELWWPFPSATPSPDEVAAFEHAVESAGVQLVALNFFGGDVPGDDAGVASIPGCADEFLASVEIAVSIGRRLGVRAFNALYGNRVDGVEPAVQDALGVRSLAAAARAAATIGATVLVEPLSGPKPYPLRTAADAMAVVQRVRDKGVDNIGLLADLYHLTVNGDDVGAAIHRYAHAVAHVQLADAPGRHEPGSGTIDFAQHLDELRAVGYSGWAALEYIPAHDSDSSLAWLPRDQRTTTR
jgi:hydroxypyruvate isomerase